METTNIVKTTMEPIDDGGRKYNLIYIVFGIVGLIAGICTGVYTIPITVPICLFVGWLIKNKILEIKAYKFRDYTFRCDNKLPYSELMHCIIPELTGMGMVVEFNKNNSPMITHNKIIYDCFYNEDMTFTIHWRMSFARAFIADNNIKNYRHISADMGIISYVIQKYTNSGGMPDGANYQGVNNMANVQFQNNGPVQNGVPTQVQEPVQNTAPVQNTVPTQVQEPVQNTASVQNSAPGNTETETFKFCAECGTKYKVGIKFCPNCGSQV